MQKIHTRTNYRQQIVAIKSIETWNNLRAELKNINSHAVLKNNILYPTH